jgi:hypothetical protein
MDEAGGTSTGPTAGRRALKLATDVAVLVAWRSWVCLSSALEPEPESLGERHSTIGSCHATQQDFAAGRVVFATFWSDWWFYLCNQHSIVSMVRSHPNHSYRRGARITTFLCALAFTFALSTWFALLLDCEPCSQAVSCHQCALLNQFQEVDDHFFENVSLKIDRPTWMFGSSHAAAAKSVIQYRSILRLGFTGALGACLWLASKSEYRANTSAVDSQVPFYANATQGTHDHGSGCFDGLAYMLEELLSKPGWSPKWDLGRMFQSDGDGNEIFGLYDEYPIVLGSFSSYMYNLSRNALAAAWTDPNYGSVNVVQQDFCPFLPSFAIQPRDSDPIFLDHCGMARAPAVSYATSFLTALVVWIYTWFLATSAQCACAVRGEQRRITVCCCQCGGWLFFCFMSALALGFLAMGMLCYVLLRPSSPVSWQPMWLFLLAQFFSAGIQVGSCALLFSVRWGWQRRRGTWDAFMVGVADGTWLPRDIDNRDDGSTVGSAALQLSTISEAGDREMPASTCVYHILPEEQAAESKRA